MTKVDRTINRISSGASDMPIMIVFNACHISSFLWPLRGVYRGNVYRAIGHQAACCSRDDVPGLRNSRTSRSHIVLCGQLLSPATASSWHYDVCPAVDAFDNRRTCD